MLSDKVFWYKVEWDRGKVLESPQYKLCWDFEFSMRKTTSARRPDLVLEDKEGKTIFLVDMACPVEKNIEEKISEKLRKYQQVAYEIRERRQGYRVWIVPLVIGCLGGGMEKVMQNAVKVFPEKHSVQRMCWEMQKVVLSESESILRKVLSGVIHD